MDRARTSTFVFFESILAILGPFHFHIHWNQLSKVPNKNLLVCLLRLYWSIQASLGNIYIFITLSFPIYEHGITIHFLVLFSLINVLCSLCRVLAHILLDLILGTWFFEVTYYKWFLFINFVFYHWLVYRNTIGFYKWFLIDLKFLLILIIHLDSSGFSMFTMSSANYDNSFSILIPFNFFFLY